MVLAEDWLSCLPDSALDSTTRDEHGHISLGKVDLGKLVAKTGRRSLRRRPVAKRSSPAFSWAMSRAALPPTRLTSCWAASSASAPIARWSENLTGHMVSVRGQLDLHYVPFADLVSQRSLKTEVRFIQPGSDFHRLARFLETTC